MIDFKGSVIPRINKLVVDGLFFVFISLSSRWASINEFKIFWCLMTVCESESILGASIKPPQLKLKDKIIWTDWISNRWRRDRGWTIVMEAGDRQRWAAILDINYLKSCWNWLPEVGCDIINPNQTKIMIVFYCNHKQRLLTLVK